MKKPILFITVLVFICGADAFYAFGQDWHLELEKDNIKVYVRDVPDSALREYRAETVLNEGIFSVSAVLDDIPAAVKWFPYCMSAGVLDELDDGRKIILNVSDFPWPFQDRYAVFSSRTRINPLQKEIVIDFVVDDSSYSRPIADFVDVDDMVQVTFMKGQWYLSMTTPDKTRVVYTICADAGGVIPIWLIKTFFEGTPYKTLYGLKQFVKKPAYQEKGADDFDVY